MHPMIESHREALRALARRHGVRSIKVFGSMARDDADASSVSICWSKPLPTPRASCSGRC